jgi:hypothetical protein
MAAVLGMNKTDFHVIKLQPTIYNPSIRNRLFEHNRIISAVRRVEFVSDAKSYTILRGCWCNIILLKCGGDEIVRLIHKLIMDIWEKEYVPKEWQKSIICPIYKKRDKLECMNYRGITLLCTAYKVFANILRNRLEPITERIIREYQAGFRPGRSTIDLVHCKTNT